MFTLIVLTGPVCSGKEIAAHYFVEKGFIYFSVFDILKEDIKKNGEKYNPVFAQLPHLNRSDTDKKDYYELACVVRRVLGKDSLGSLVEEKSKSIYPQSCVVNLFTHPDDISPLQDKPSFFLISISAPICLRFERYCSKYGKIGMEDFCQRDDFLNFGMYTKDEYSPCVNAVMERADCSIINVKKKEDIYSLLDSLSLNKPVNTLRPGWEEYFMLLAWVTASRSNCVRHKIGAIIVDAQHRVVATGYNGTPRKMGMCIEGECKRCNDMKTESGKDLGECICLHAEESSLLEAGN
eukprot:TRINITY_DN2975_c0_g1_i1.p1 TRINITY_DN2975_c0_g1~~TRINITY_DN2975_c0_g1_i1.p1  ORF type:complete len:294 (-),score=63.74 TRINITY_DN2975_c0_g1_i1:89-970(-)